MSKDPPVCGVSKVNLDLLAREESLVRTDLLDHKAQQVISSQNYTFT